MTVILRRCLQASYSLFGLYEQLSPIGVSDADYQCGSGNSELYIPLYSLFQRIFPVCDLATDWRGAALFQAALRGDDPLYVNDIESVIKSAPGIRDAYFNNISVTDSSEKEPITPVNGQITIPAGYFNFARELVEMQSVNPVEPTGKTTSIYLQCDVTSHRHTEACISTFTA